jgi:predicted DCC family thiol-disulfide oxidoreductase YuxK
MNTAYPLTVYFDASCALCNSEMQNIKRRDTNNALILIDCSAAEFDDTCFKAQGITRAAMMNCLHARDADGAWLKGVAAFEVIYRSVGMAAIAKFWGHPLTRPLAERAYPWVVRHRHVLSALRLHKLFGLWSQRAAQQSNLKSQACKDGQCSIPSR